MTVVTDVRVIFTYEIQLALAGCVTACRAAVAGAAAGVPGPLKNGVPPAVGLPWAGYLDVYVIQMPGPFIIPYTIIRLVVASTGAGTLLKLTMGFFEGVR